MNFAIWFNQKFPGIPLKSAEQVLLLSGEGATVPFMARYRKEQTGNLDEVAIQSVLDADETWNNMIKRKEFVLGEIEHQKKLTPELKKKIEETFDPDKLEDLYLPYKQKRKTKAALAKEAGLEPLAQLIWDVGHKITAWPEGQTLEIVAQTYVSGDGPAKDLDSVLSGAQDILTEKIAEEASLRQLVRETVFKQGHLKSKKAEAVENSKVEKYFDYSESVTLLMDSANSHRYLAMKRGWTEKELSLSIGPKPVEVNSDTTKKVVVETYEDQLLKTFVSFACQDSESPGAKILQMAARLALKVYVLPNIEAEVHRELKAVADEAAIKVFSENVRKLLLAAPFGPKSVLGIDPGIRTGCKLVVISQAGQYLDSTVVFLQTDSERRQASEKILKCIQEAKIESIAIGNGTASRESESFVADMIKEIERPLHYAIVSEAGASVYSASKLATEEYPDINVGKPGFVHQKCQYSGKHGGAQDDREHHRLNHLDF